MGGVAAFALGVAGCMGRQHVRDPMDVILSNDPDWRVGSEPRRVPTPEAPQQDAAAAPPAPASGTPDPRIR